MLQNVLFLGSSSFIGINLIQKLQNTYSNIFYICIDQNYSYNVRSDIYYNLDLTTENTIPLIIDLIEKYNINCIVNLASCVGIQTFNSNNAFSAGLNNLKLLNNLLTILKYKKRPNLKVVQFSTSEVFGATNTLDTFQITNNNIRSIYSQIKLLGETAIIELQKLGYIKTYHIIRPFNPSGKFQTQGVTYDMYKSAINTSKIYYRKNTTRTITDIQNICSCYISDITSSNNTIKNYYYDQAIQFCCSIKLKTLALVIKNYCELKYNKNIILFEQDTDDVIQYRHYDKLKTYSQCKNYIFNILDQYNDNY